MKIAIDVSPLSAKNRSQHAVRGSGFYIENLKESLLKYFPEHSYIFFTKEREVPKDCDLIHYPYFEPFFMTFPFKKRFKTVITVHDLIPLVFKEHFPVGIKGRTKWEVQKQALRNADAIITDSICSKKDIIKYTGVLEKKIHVVYLAASETFKEIDNILILGSIRKKYNLPDKFALYVGDVTWNKNLPRLLEAVTKIDVPLVMVGKALINKNFDRKHSWNQDLVKVQELANDDKRIIRLGFVPTDDLVILYNLATVFVMPSLYEGFGLPILEAMSCGCPVVTTRGGSIPEVAEEAAMYGEVSNSDDIARSIYTVFQNEKIQRDLSERGLMQVKRFTWRKTIEGTMRVYEKKN